MKATSTKYPCTDADFQAEILRITKTKCLPWLKQWCTANNLSRTYWVDLYKDIISLLDGSDRRVREEVYCCVQEEINEIEAKSREICHLLGWIVIDSTSGLGSHEIYDGNILLETIFQYSNGFALFSSKGSHLHGDIYSAALSLLPATILQHKINVKKLQLSLAIKN